ncbi:MAG: hypothetical protein HQ402_01320 [Parcubacteria group bacterium]|nr:hypothetical protein [Parcubacteria group bacterium]
MKKGEIAKTILKTLVSSGAVLALLALPGMSPMLKLFGNTDKTKKYKLNKSLRKLKEKKFVNIYYKDGREFIEITEKGKKKLLAYDFDDLEIVKPKKWDGLWRIVIFDIPEKKKYVRDTLNIKLKELGFKPIQKSTFVLPYDCEDLVCFIREHLYARDGIQYILAKKIEGESDLKDYFGI